MKKNEFIVRDSLPDTPDSFYSEVERSLSACCDKKEERSWSLKRLPRRLLIPMVAAATLLIATTAVAAGMLFRSSYSPGNYLNDPKESREEHGQAIPNVEAAIASAAPETGDYTITMLPEFDNAEEMDGWRVKLGQPKYDEAAWGWMRKIRPEIREVLYDGRNCTFTMRLHTDHGLSFNWPREDEGQWVEALVDDAWFRMEGEEKTHSVLASGGIQSFDETGATLLGEIDKEAPFPQEGRVELTIVVGLRDARVDDMATIGIVGRIFYTFSFDVAAAREASENAATETGE